VKSTRLHAATLMPSSGSVCLWAAIVLLAQSPRNRALLHDHLLVLRARVASPGTTVLLLTPARDREAGQGK